jgi:hypothetical protein
MLISVCPLEPKNDSSPIAEIALVLVALSKTVAEPRQHKIKLCRPDGERFGHGNIDSSTDDEIEGIVARGCSGSATRLASLE